MLVDAACTFRSEVPQGTVLSCAGPSDCSAGLLCLGEWGVCVPTLQPCIVADGDAAALAPDGALCDGGICLRGECVAPGCGDGLRSDGEQCDDGNAADDDACRTDCTNARCGDGVVWAGTEECDDGNDTNDDACLTTCRANRCGDGSLNAAVEECDDGNDVEEDACLSTCLRNVCGDGFVLPGVEACDDGNDVDEDDCKSDCTRASCGDGILYSATEECDDGNDVDEDSCLTTCVRNVCGDGLLQPDTEECDDGNAYNDDACLTPCLLNRCGDGLLHVGVEFCDDGDADDSNACRTSCIWNVCGDGVVHAGVEICDDGNTVSGDGCRSDCGKIELCGDGLLDDGEACDDANDNELDLCTGCRKTTWTPVVHLGLGAGDGDPRAIALSASALAVDAAGNAYIAGLSDMFIHRLDAATRKLTRYAGTGTATNVGGDTGVPASDVNMAGVVGLSVDGLGSLLVTDLDEAVIRRIDVRTRTVVTIAGTGEQGFGGDGLPANAALLHLPEMAVADGSGNIYIADTLNHRIRRVDAQTGVISTVAGTGTAGFGGDGGDPMGAEFNKPRDLDFDRAGNLYVLDRGNGRIRRLEPDPDDRSRFIRITTVVGDNSGYDPAGTGLLRGIGTLGLQSIALSPDGERIYITSREYTGVLVADLAAESVTVFAGNPSEPGAVANVPALDARFSELWAVAVDGPDRVYVCESDSGLVHAIERTSATAPWHVRTVGGSTPAVVDDDSAVFLAVLMRHMNTGYAISTRPGCASQRHRIDLHAALPRSHRLLERTCSGAVRVLAGTGAAGFAGERGLARLAQLSSPRGVTIDNASMLYLADSGNHRVRSIDASGLIHTVAGTGAAAFGGDGGGALSASLNLPMDVQLDDRQRLLITDSGNNRIRRVTPATGLIETIAGTGTQAASADGVLPTTRALAQPFGARFISGSSIIPNATGGFLVFSERRGHRVRVLMDLQLPDVPPELLPPRIFTLAGTGQPGYRDADDATQGQLDHPRSVALFNGAGCSGAPGDAAVCVLVLDGYDRVRMLHLRPGDIETAPIVAELTTLIGGAAPVDDGPFESAALRGPSSFTFLDDSRALVVERVTGRLRLVDLAARDVRTLSGLPDGENTEGDGVRQDIARPLLEPASVAYDSTASPRRLYVAERGGHTVREFTLPDIDAPSTWTTRTLAGRLGAPGHRDGALAGARFDGPSGLALDPRTRRLYVAEHGNQTIRRIDLEAGTVTTIAGRPGQLGSYGDNVPAEQALLYNPSGLALVRDAGDTGASLYLADTGNNRVRRIDNVDDVDNTDGPGPTISTVLGDGAAASSGEGGPARFFPIHAPTGLDVDAAGNVYATSLNAVRVVLSHDDGRALGDDAVASIYGAPPRRIFPEPISTCIQQLRVSPAGDTVFLVDECQGLLVELVRSTSP